MVGAAKPDLELRAETAETLLFSTREKLNAALDENERLREQVAMLSRELDKEDEEPAPEAKEDKLHGYQRMMMESVERKLESAVAMQLRKSAGTGIWMDELTTMEPYPGGYEGVEMPPWVTENARNERYTPPQRIDVTNALDRGEFHVYIKLSGGRNFMIRFRDRKLMEYEVHDEVDRFVKKEYHTSFSRSQAKRDVIVDLLPKLHAAGATLWDGWKYIDRI